MQLQSFGIKGGSRKALVVIGAGASRGASFVKNGSCARPPLDADFFQQLSKLPDSTASQEMLQFIRTEYGHEVGLSMEQFFSEADYTNRFHDELNVDRGPRIKRYQRALRNFYEAIADILRETTLDVCTHHEAIARVLHAGDSVISFNYDCIMDRALRDNAGIRWLPEKKGYGVPVTGAYAYWRKRAKGHPPKHPIQLLKMHGSMNWRIVQSSSIALVRDLHNVNSLEDMIIPPTWFKNLATFPFSEIWKRARIAVRRARIIIVAGYSLPATDLFSQSLFKVEAGSKEKREKLDLLVLANPDCNARMRFIDAVKGGLEASTRILEYDTIEELADVLEIHEGRQ